MIICNTHISKAFKLSTWSKLCWNFCYTQSPTHLSIFSVCPWWRSVADYKNLGVHIDNKLDLTLNSTVLFKKGQSRLYFLRRLKSFNICNTLLRMFYESVVSSVLSFAVVCWGSSMKVADRNKLDKLIRRAGSVLGMELDPVHVVAERRMLSKFDSILDNPSHPLHNVLVDQRSTFSQRMITAKCSTERFRRSFIPVAIRLYNSSL